MITGNEPAFARVAASQHGMTVGSQTGLTIRQHFAAMAMQGILANEALAKTLKSVSQPLRHTSIAETATLQADALIAELNKNNQ